MKRLLSLACLILLAFTSPALGQVFSRGVPAGYTGTPKSKVSDPCDRDRLLYPFVNHETVPIKIDLSELGQRLLRKVGLNTEPSGLVIVPGQRYICAPFPMGQPYPGRIFVPDGVRKDGVAGSIERGTNLYVTYLFDEGAFMYSLAPLAPERQEK